MIGGSGTLWGLHDRKIWRVRGVDNLKSTIEESEVSTIFYLNKWNNRWVTYCKNYHRVSLILSKVKSLREDVLRLRPKIIQNNTPRNPLYLYGKYGVVLSSLHVTSIKYRKMSVSRDTTVPSRDEEHTVQRCPDGTDR